MTKILDCTIRDGGFLCDWNFDKDYFTKVLSTAIDTGIDYFEIGYRSFARGGIFRRCLKSEVGDLVKGFSNINLVVMLNVSEFEEDLFGDDDFISTVRVACHRVEIKKGIKICEYLLDKGYKVFLHLMDLKDFDCEDFAILHNWERKSELESVYFADSYGSFFSNDVKNFYNRLKECGIERISFHSHNNIQMAFSNSIEAVNLGAYSIDATLGGKGRGGGNLPIELWVAYVNKIDLKRLFTIYRQVFSNEEVEKFKSIVSGIGGIHPFKVDDFLSENFS